MFDILSEANPNGLDPGQKCSAQLNSIKNTKWLTSKKFLFKSEMEQRGCFHKTTALLSLDARGQIIR
jgi:hypothetical protein